MSRDFVCQKCGGDLLGDGYTTVVHCENADWDKYRFVEPDALPVLCDFTMEERFEGIPLTDDPWRHEERFKNRICSKCGISVAENRQKYCGDGSDKDNGHRWIDRK